MVGTLLDRGFAKPPTIAFWTVPVYLIGLFFVRGVSTFVTTYLMTAVSTRLLNELRQKMFERLLDVPLGYYSSTSSVQVINSMMFEVQQVIDMIKNVIINFIRSALTAIALISYLFYLNWQLALVTFFLIPTSASIVRATGKRLSVLTQRYLAINAELTQVLQETTRAHQVIKLFGGQKYEKDRFDARAEKLRSYAVKMASTFAATVPITQLLTAVAVSVVVVVALIRGDSRRTYARRVRQIHHDHAADSGAVEAIGRSEWTFAEGLVGIGRRIRSDRCARRADRWPCVDHQSRGKD